jgi:deoxyribose-phosphate aldolase
MKLTARDVAHLIDISAVQASHGEAEIRDCVRSAKEYRFKEVYALPCWTAFIRELLADRPDILVGGAIGFPSGANHTTIKLAEANQLVQDGAQELDMMLNVGKLRSGAYRYCEDEIRAVVQAVGGRPVKVILEVNYLNIDQIKKACELSINAEAAFVKTGTGWAPGGTNLDIVQLIITFVGNAIKVKASGGIRNLDILLKMYRMGISRFGINLISATEIVRSVAALPGGAVEI